MNAQRTPFIGSARFRARLLAAMMLVAMSITGVALMIAQRNVATNFETEMKREFENQIGVQRELLHVQRDVLAERCRLLVARRIQPAFEDGAPDQVYPAAQEELPDALAKELDQDQTVPELKPRFYRFLNERGTVIPVPDEHFGKLGDVDVNVKDQDLQLPGVPQQPQVGFVPVRTPDPNETIDEVIVTPIFSRTANAVVAALVIGFKPLEFDPEAQASGKIKAGIWLNGRLQMAAVSSASQRMIAVALKAATPSGSAGSTRLPDEIDGVPHQLFYQQLNPGSHYPTAYEVGLYSLADVLKRQRNLRWNIVGMGVALLLISIGASHLLSARLSKPVETLEVVSAQNVIQRERAEAALDVTNEELRTRNAELQEALASLEAAQQQVIQQERLRALGQMASGIAHDFNNALVPILGFCELLQMSPKVLSDRKKCLGYLETIQTAAKDAANVVSRLREFYRANEDDEEFAAVHLKRLVEQAVKLTQPKWKDQAQANGATIKLVTHLADVAPVRANESALREVLTNLVFNAVDAMPDGGVITIRTRDEGDRAILEVGDSGTGMTEEVRRRCLEPFFSTKGEKGTGLGLSMVFGIVQRHEGTIDLESEVGHGTTFRISLPLYHEGETTAVAKQAPASRPLRVLVVDDEAPVREMLSAALVHDGHQVQVADQGVEGLRQFMAGKFDLVVTDKAMPGMSGDQMATAIKQVAPHTPIILLTGFGQFLDREKLPSIDVLATKPIGLANLREAIARAVEIA